MPSGIKAKDIVVGTGAEAVRGKVVYAHVQMTLNHGDILLDSVADGKPIRIDLGKRDCMAGLQKGIEGMCVGGRRHLKISPPLAYGVEGAPASGIPANAVVQCDVELLEVRELGTIKPENNPQVRQLLIHHPGESSPGRPRWQLVLFEDGRCGVCLRYPVPGGTWRHAVEKYVSAPKLDRDAMEALFVEAVEIPKRHPTACLGDGMVGSQGGYSVIRDESGRPCLDIIFYDRGQAPCRYYMVITDPAWLESRLYAFVNSFLRPYLDVVFHSGGDGVTGQRQEEATQ